MRAESVEERTQRLFGNQGGSERRPAVGFAPEPQKGGLFSEKRSRHVVENKSTSVFGSVAKPLGY
jgi:hypothetical protein